MYEKSGQFLTVKNQASGLVMTKREGFRVFSMFFQKNDGSDNDWYRVKWFREDATGKKDKDIVVETKDKDQQFTINGSFVVIDKWTYHILFGYFNRNSSIGEPSIIPIWDDGHLYGHIDSIRCKLNEQENYKESMEQITEIVQEAAKLWLVVQKRIRKSLKKK
jgi:hypothetical protein